MSTNHVLQQARKNGTHLLNNVQEGFLGQVQDAAINGKKSLLKWKRAASGAIFDGTEKVKDTAVQLNRQVRKNPWPVIAGTAAAAIVVGFILGRTGRKSWD